MRRHFQGYGPDFAAKRVQHCIECHAPVIMLAVCPVAGIKRFVAGRHGFGDTSRFSDVYLVYALYAQITPVG